MSLAIASPRRRADRCAPAAWPGGMSGVRLVLSQAADSAATRRASGAGSAAPVAKCVAAPHEGRAISPTL